MHQPLASAFTSLPLAPCPCRQINIVFDIKCVSFLWKATVMAKQRLNCAVTICAFSLYCLRYQTCVSCVTSKFVLLYLSAPVIDCGTPQSFPNGNFTLVNGSTTLNSTVKYECKTGFQLVGSANRICQSNEQWSGQEPMCESKFQLSMTDCVANRTPISVLKNF